MIFVSWEFTFELHWKLEEVRHCHNLHLYELNPFLDTCKVLTQKMIMLVPLYSMVLNRFIDAPRTLLSWQVRTVLQIFQHYWQQGSTQSEVCEICNCIGGIEYLKYQCIYIIYMFNTRWTDAFNIYMSIILNRSFKLRFELILKFWKFKNSKTDSTLYGKKRCSWRFHWFSNLTKNPVKYVRIFE